ncbi:MAG: hypothetical protein WA485_15390 [Candidatus Sulfotelmatobacter sp.]
MRSGYKNLAAMCLSAALMSPIAALAMPRPQDDHERHEQEEREHRVYDPAYKDYHNWDQREDGAYRGWLDERHEAYVDYDKLDHKRQEDYWRWRHKHGDHDDHDDRDRH